MIVCCVSVAFEKGGSMDLKLFNSSGCSPLKPILLLLLPLTLIVSASPHAVIASPDPVQSGHCCCHCHDTDADCCAAAFYAISMAENSEWLSSTSNCSPP